MTFHLFQQEHQFQQISSHESRYGDGLILTPVQFVSISNLKRLAYEAEIARNHLSSGQAQTDNLPSRDSTHKQITIQLGHDSNRRFTIKNNSGRRIHLTLGRRHDSAQINHRQVRVRFPNHPENGMDSSQFASRNVNVNEFSSTNAHSPGIQRQSPQIVLLRNRPNGVQKRVIIRTGSGSNGSPTRRVFRILFVGSGMNRRNHVFIQREVTRGQPSTSTRNHNVPQYSQFAPINTAQGHLQDTIQSHFQGQVQDTTLSQVQGHIQDHAQAPIQEHGPIHNQGQVQDPIQSQFQDQVQDTTLSQVQGHAQDQAQAPIAEHGLIHSQVQVQKQGQSQDHAPIQSQGQIQSQVQSQDQLLSLAQSQTESPIKSQGQFLSQDTTTSGPLEIIDTEEPERNPQTTNQTTYSGHQKRHQTTTLPADGDSEEIINSLLAQLLTSNPT